MAKPELEFTDYRQFEEVPFSKVQGLTERVIANDPESGVATRILIFAPGTDTSPNGVQIHDFWEELYIIEGSIYDLTLKQEFTAGMIPETQEEIMLHESAKQRAEMRKFRREGSKEFSDHLQMKFPWE
ncbi:hypothetical protein [Paenibacillus tyrfis]|uniref:hypothetical protein n=1 Tax=Paenibacillus tyrfis TaxID=1501230 RepID=UPI000B5912B8|nr:hypothetical protein [Paenibacillus tyrfis]